MFGELVLFKHHYLLKTKVIVLWSTVHSRFSVAPPKQSSGQTDYKLPRNNKNNEWANRTFLLLANIGKLARKPFSLKKCLLKKCRRNMENFCFVWPKKSVFVCPSHWHGEAKVSSRLLLFSSGRVRSSFVTGGFSMQERWGSKRRKKLGSKRRTQKRSLWKRFGRFFLTEKVWHTGLRSWFSKDHKYTWRRGIVVFATFPGTFKMFIVQ